MSDTLRDFIENGCSARAEDKHHALQELVALRAHVEELERGKERLLGCVERMRQAVLQDDWYEFDAAIDAAAQQSSPPQVSDSVSVGVESGLRSTITPAAGGS